MSGPNIPCELTGIPSIGRSQTNVDEKHVDLPELRNLAEDLEAGTIARAIARPPSIFPFDRLSREIIAEIFWNCLVHDEREIVWMSSGNAPLLLCRVSSSWRALALTIPQLWASVGVLIRHPNNIDPSICAHVINTWLERSGALPLTVAIEYTKRNCHDRSRRTNSTILADVLSVVYSHSSRWKNVAITTWLPVSFPQLKTLPLLRSFHLQGFDFISGDSVISLPFSASPRLTQLSWPYPFEATTPDPRIPWSQISHLCLTVNMTFFAASEMIRLCPQLENFTMDLIGENSGDRQPTTVENRRLRTLEINAHSDCSPLLDSLVLPKLRELYLVGVPRRGNGRGAFLAFLTRSNCQLYKLALVSCAFEPFREFLEHKSFKCIKELKIDIDPLFTDNELISLTDFPSPPAPAVLLPKLTQLTLQWCLHASRSKLAEMVLSRRRQRDGHEVEPLRHLVVSNESLYQGDVDSIKDEVKDGFEADIETDFTLNENGEVM